MGIFVRNTSLALTWTPTSCHAVRLEGGSNGCEVVAAWSGECAGGDSLAELAARAVREVGGNDSIYIVAGGSGQGWGMADLTMPRLKSEELRTALEFEVRKQTPLPGDKLRWGYRLLPQAKRGDGRQPVRLYYVRTEHWESWLKALAGLHHVDAMLPAPAALDPLLAGKALVVPGGEHQPNACEYRSEEGRRLIAAAAEPPADLPAALPFPGLQLGVLNQRSAAERLAFTQAVLLAMYGLSAAVTDDRHTAIPLPEHLTTHRHVALKGIAACLAVYLLCLVAFTVAGRMQFKAAQIRRVDVAIAQARKELEAVNKLLDPKDAERGALLRKEILDNTESRPDFPSVLMEITRAVQAPAWASQSLEWKDGTVTVQIQGPTKDLELAARLESSPYIGDVAERLSSFNQSTNAYVQRFEMVARFDSPEEEALVKMQQEKKRRQEEATQAALREAERKAAEEAAAQEAQESEEAEELEEDEAGADEEPSVPSASTGASPKEGAV